MQHRNIFNLLANTDKSIRVIIFMVAMVVTLPVKVIAEEIPLLCRDALNADSYKPESLTRFKYLRDGASGWIFRDHDLKSQFGPDEQGYAKLRNFVKLLENNDTRLIMVPIPARGIVHPEKLGEIDYDYETGRKEYINFLNKLRALNIIVPPIENLFVKNQIKDLIFKRDHHWNGHAAKKIAKMTAKMIKKTPGYHKLHKIDFTSEVTGKSQINGSIQIAASQICGLSYPPEEYYMFSTRREKSTDIKTKAVDDGIVLVGTCNSKSRRQYNFDGFLRQYLNTEVKNMATCDGGHDIAMRNYLKSSHYRHNPPRYLIWEFPSYYDLKDIKFYDELVQLVEHNSELNR